MVRAERKEREFNARRAEILEQASASGFSTGSLYQFFEGKENLYTSMITEKLDLMYTEIMKRNPKS